MTDPRSLIEPYLADLRAALRLRGIPSSDLTDEVYDHLVEVADAAIRRGEQPMDACEAAMARLGAPATLAARLAIAEERAINRFVLPLAIVCGLAINWIDSRPDWDDTGVTAGLLMVTAGVFSFLAPHRVWLIALAVGIWIPLHGIVTTGNFSILLVLLFPLAGAYAALGIRKLAAAAGA